MAELIFFPALVIGIMLIYVVWNHRDSIKEFNKALFDKYSLLFRVTIAFAFILFTIGYANYLHQKEPRLLTSELAKFVVSGLVVVGLFYSILAFEFNVRKSKLDRKSAQATTTFTAISAWHNAPLIDYSKHVKIFDKSKSHKMLSGDINLFIAWFEGDTQEELNKSIRGIFNYFETIGTAVKMGVVDQDFIRGFFYSIFIDYYDDWLPYIQKRREKTPELWKEFTTLAEDWQKIKKNTS